LLACFVVYFVVFAVLYFLDHSLVLGSGVGKSTIVWAWALCRAKHETVYWLHLGRSGYLGAILRAEGIEWCGLTDIGQFVGKCENGCLIVDGLTEGQRLNVLPFCSKWRVDDSTSRRLIVVSSAALKFV
jgi:hypothetical protein